MHVSNKMEFTRGDVIAEKYEVVDLLDENPLGFAYRVKHQESGKYIRLLVFRPRVANRDAKEQLIRSFKEAKSAKHDNLIKLGELGEHQGMAYVTMEDFAGTSLREFIQDYKIQGKPFDVKEAAQITIQILEGIEAAKDRQFHFRALRPEYVLINVKRIGPRNANFVANVKLLYMGFWDLVPSATLAEDEFNRGEAQYIAPELKSFEPKADERCDVYSAGVIFYEMVVGVAPVGTFQLPKSRRPDLPDHVNNVAELALAHSPDDRYQTARDFIMDIQRIFDGSGMDSGKRMSLVTPLLFATMLAALVLVVLVAIILFNLQKDPLAQAEANDATIRNKVVADVRDQMPSGDEVKRVLANHPPNMAYVPAGTYLSGALHIEKLNDFALPSEPIAQEVETGAYVIDLFEFPNLANAEPLLNLTQFEAAKKCEEVGKRLCTANEWEKACKGPNMYAYSYGDTFDPEFCGNGLDDVGRAGSRPNCKTGWGPFDMSGNFREWTSTLRAGSDSRVEVKGGVRAAAEKGTRCAFSKDERNTLGDRSIGFRCCRDADAPPWTPPAPTPGEEAPPAP
jgi:serine/threonine protein kinase